MTVGISHFDLFLCVNFIILVLLFLWLLVVFLLRWVDGLADLEDVCAYSELADLCSCCCLHSRSGYRSARLVFDVPLRVLRTVRRICGRPVLQVLTSPSLTAQVMELPGRMSRYLPPGAPWCKYSTSERSERVECLQHVWTGKRRHVDYLLFGSIPDHYHD